MNLNLAAITGGTQTSSDKTTPGNIARTDSQVKNTQTRNNLKSPAGDSLTLSRAALEQLSNQPAPPESLARAKELKKIENIMGDNLSKFLNDGAAPSITTASAIPGPDNGSAAESQYVSRYPLIENTAQQISDALKSEVESAHDEAEILEQSRQFIRARFKKPDADPVNNDINYFLNSVHDLATQKLAGPADEPALPK